MAKKQSTYYTHEVIAERMAVKEDDLRSRKVRKSTLYSVLVCTFTVRVIII